MGFHLALEAGALVGQVLVQPQIAQDRVLPLQAQIGELKAKKLGLGAAIEEDHRAGPLGCQGPGPDAHHTLT